VTDVTLAHRAPLLLPLRYAFRELRGGLRGFYVLIACIALGVFAIAGVGSVAASLADGLAREGRIILGGDVSLSLIQREATADERAAIEKLGTVSVAATTRAMARTSDGRLALVELKAVDRNYPLLGSLSLNPDMPVPALLEARDGVYGAASDATFLARLNLKLGDRVTIGSATFEIRSVVVSEPDKLAIGVGFGPRFMVSEDALRATDLLQPGSLVRWIYRVVLPDGATDPDAADRAADTLRQTHSQAGWEIRTRNNASPQLERDITHFTQFLTLVGLTALLVGGVGVANAVKSHIDRRRDVIATLKAVGATGNGVFRIYFAQVMLLAVLGSVIGLALGAVLPFLIVALVGSILPLPIEAAFHPGALTLAFLYGLLTALAFAIWPLGRVHDMAVSALFRDQISPDKRWPRRRYLVFMAIVIALLAGIAIGLSYDHKLAAIFVCSCVVVFAALRLLAEGVMWLARAWPRPRSTMMRLAISNIYRPGALTPSVVMSLGLGLALLVTVTQIDGNLRRQFSAALPDKAPSFFFVDIPSADADRFESFVKQKVPDGTFEDVPMLRGRIVAANDVPVEQLKPDAEAEWVLQSDRGLSYTGEVPAGSRVVEGQWWGPNYSGPPLVSFEKKLADGLGLKIGDVITINVLGRNMNATISNMRMVDWQNLGINFVMVFSPGTFAGAPHTHVATLTEQTPTPQGDAAIVHAVADAFPRVTAIGVREALETIGTVVTNIVIAIRGASSITLIAAMLVLGGALAAGHRHRVYDAVILKTLGATKARLIGAYAFEYLLLGLATAVFGVIAGSVAAWLIVTRLMTLSFVWQAEAAILVVVSALIVTVVLGLVGTLLALNQKPASVLRNF
jgi:putative ABC transport system permease protein